MLPSLKYSLVGKYLKSIKVRLFVYCPNFSNSYIFLNKKPDKFGIAGKPQSIGILEWEIFKEKRRIKIENNIDINFQHFIKKWSNTFKQFVGNSR